MDLETTGLSPLDSRILLCQIGTANNQWVINTGVLSIAPLLPYLRSYKWTKIIQNAKFEQKFFQHFFKVRINNIFDTFLAESILNPDTSRGFSSLEWLARNYLNEDLKKDTRLSFVGHTSSSFSEDQIAYAAKDVEVLFPIMEQQIIKRDNLNLKNIFDLEFELAGVVASMELTGAPVNVPLWKSKIKRFEEAHEASRLRMHEILFDDGGLSEQLGLFIREGININSNKQIKDAFLKIGINVDATNEREISLVNHPAAVELLNYRGLQKILSSYGSSFLDKVHPFTGRIHADFQQMGTETGRFSCKDPNLQQMPGEFRECISSPDYMIVGADYANIELRILAEVSGDEMLTRAFTSGDDPHKSTAALMFNIPISAVTKEQRFIAKTINFGISYGMGTKKLMDMLNSEAYKNKTTALKFPQVQDMMNRYHKTYAKATRWLHDTGTAAFMRGYSDTLYGRKRFYNRPDPNGLDERDYDNQVAAIKRKGANSPIQGTNADITKLAMIDLRDEIEGAGFKANIIIQVHDEIVLLAQKNQAQEVKEIVESSMNRSAAKIIKKVPVKTDAYIAEVWKK